MNERERMERKKVGALEAREWYGSSGANQSKIKCIYIFRWALLVSLSNYFISIFHLHAAQSESTKPWANPACVCEYVLPHHYFITLGPFSLVRWLSNPRGSLPLSGSLPYPFLSVRTCSPYLPLALCSCCLMPCFMHPPMQPHMCPENMCAERFTLNAPLIAMFYAFRRPGRDNYRILMRHFSEMPSYSHPPLNSSN